MKYFITILFFLPFLVQAQTPCSPGFKKVDSLTFFDVLPITWSREQQKGEQNSVISEPAQFFDEQGADPYNSVLTPTPTTGNMPSSQIAYPQWERQEYRFALDLRAGWDIRKAYFYVANGGYVGDTIRVYAGNDLNNMTQVGQGVYATTAASGWYLIDIPGTAVNVKYIMIGLHGKYYSGIGKWSSNQVNEVILYGCPLTSRKTMWKPYTSASPRPRQPIANITGTVLTEGYDSVQLFKYKRSVRSMVEWGWYSDDSTTFNLGVTPIHNWNHDFNTQTGSGNQTLGVPSPYSTTELGYRDSLAHEALGGHNQPVYVWPTIMGSNGRAVKYGEPTRGNATDEYGQDPTKFVNYRRWAHWAFAYAKMFGTNNGDTTVFVSVNNPKGLRFANQQIGHEFETDNEPYGSYGALDTGSRATIGNSVTRYQWPRVIAVKSIMAYDGNAAGSTSKQGIINGDAAPVLIEPGNYFLDSAALLADHRLTRILRTDSAKMFTWANLHWYPNKLSDPLNPYSAYVGQHAVEANYGQYVQKYINFAYSIDTSIKVMISETGYDRVLGSIFTVKRSGTAWDDGKWQAINLGYLLAEIATTSIERLNLYQLKCNNCTETSSGSFQGTHEVRSYAQRQFFPAFYYVNAIIQLLQNYTFSDTLAHKWRGQVVYRFRNTSNSSQVRLLVGYADTTGMNYNLPVPIGATTGTITEYVVPLDATGITSSTITTGTDRFAWRQNYERLLVYDYIEAPTVVTKLSPTITFR